MQQRGRKPDIALGGDTDGGELVANTVDQLEPVGPPTRIANANHDDTPNMTGMDELVRLMRKQTELTEQLLAKAAREKADDVAEALPPSSSEPAGDVSREILDVLRRMDERQGASDMSKQPIPQAPATSAAAWSPLLRAHLDHIQPTVDRWRGTLDTILVFIALFSAIVTTFFVQSLEGLSQDPGDRTNELLLNLTELVIAVSGVNASHLTIQLPTAFEPEESAVRLNFYLSISLILSISVAALAVTSRGYVAMLTRSRHTQAHKKLGDLHRRWLHANDLLAPAVEFLPQFLILPIVLFVVGLLDNIISSSLPLSTSLAPVFIAGVLSAIFVVSVAIYTIWTVCHGWLNPEISPFQSTISHLLVLYGPLMGQCFKRIQRCILRYWKTLTSGPVWNHSPPSDELSVSYEASANGRVTDSISRRGQPDALKTDDQDSVLAPHDVEAFYQTLLVTHDDDVIDQAVAAYTALTLHSSTYSRPHTDADWWFPATYQINLLAFMLSDEASIRTNLSAATFIANLFNSEFRGVNRLLNARYPQASYSKWEVVYFLPLVKRAAEIYSAAATGHEHSHVLWNSPFPKAICALVDSQNMIGDLTYSLRGTPVIWLLLNNIPYVQACASPQKPFKNHPIKMVLWEVFYSEALRLTRAPSNLSFEEAVDHLLKPCEDMWHQNYYLNCLIFQRISAEFMASGLMWTRVNPTRKIAKAFIQWFTRRRHEASTVLSFHHISSALPRVIEIVSMQFDWNDGYPTPSVADVAQPVVDGFDWLSFILQETNFILASESSMDLAPTESLVLMRSCIDMIQLLQAYDRRIQQFPDVWWYDTTPFSHAARSSEHAQSTNLWCSSLCWLREHIKCSVELVRKKAPDTRLDVASWRKLVHILTAGCGPSEEVDTSLLDIFDWTPESHRERVQRDVLKAFEWWCPDPYASVISIPWSWLEEGTFGDSESL